MMVRRPGRDGFTLIELLVVVTVAAVVITMGTLAFSDYFQRDSARRAAQVFAQDLTAARSQAVRAQEKVVVRFSEVGLWYEVMTAQTATEIARRRFGTNADIDLSGVTLDTVGDSIVFDTRGMLDVSGWGGSLATATFSSGAITYRVSFNGMGASKIEQT